MKTNAMRWRALVCLVACCALARAETGVTNIMNGGTINWGGNYTVGTNGALNALIVTNAGVLNVTGRSIIGDSATATNNYALVVGPGSLWTNSSSLYVGNFGSGNQLTITNGGQVSVGANSFVGSSPDGNSNSVTVSGIGSRWDSSGGLYVGYSGCFNRLTINNGGVVSNLNASIGNYIAYGLQSNNTVLVDGPGSKWIIADTIFISRRGTDNGMTIRNGGVVTVATNVGVGTEGEGENNFLTIDGAGSVLDVGAELAVGGAGGFNTLLVTNGARLSCHFGNLGSLSGMNRAVITGNGSLWNNDLLLVGRFGNLNSLIIADNGTVTAGTVMVGSNSPSGGNSITINSGNLFVTNVAGSGLLDVRYGGLALNSGTVTVNQLIVTNGASSVVTFNGGTLNSGSSAITNGLPFQVGNGTSAATLHLSGGTHSFSDGLFINTNATLTGTGLISSIVTNAGTIAPGNSAGSLNFSTNLILASNGQLVMELSGTNDWLYDQINVAGTLTFAGSLTVSLSGGFTPQAGDRFDLFDFGSLSGAFGVTNLPALSPGLVWNTSQLYTNGEISVGGSSLTNIIDGFTMNYPGTYFVGSNGAFYGLIITNAGVLTSGAGVVGNSAISSNNNAWVTGVGSLWSNSGNLTVGATGAFNQLTVTNGGRVINSLGYVGNNPSASNNAVLVSGSGSRWDNRGDLYVGSQGNGNRLIINNGGVVSNLNASLGNYMAVGFQYSNTVLVDGPGSTWIIGESLPLSRRGSGNGLTIRNGGTVWAGSNLFVGTEAEGDNNFLTVDGTGSVLNVGVELVSGGFGSANTLLVTNGALVLSRVGNVGSEPGGINNTAIVTGIGSVWSNNLLQVGRLGSGSLTIADNGTVTASTLLVGSNSPSSGNSIIVNSGNLFVTNAAGTGLLDVRRGSLNVNSGTVTVNRLTVTNGVNSTFAFNGGTLASAGSTVSNAAQFRTGDGTTAATLHLDGGTHSFANGLFINTNASLTGTGAVFGVITNAGTIAPGDSAGIITDTGSLTLLGTTLLLMELAGVDASFYDQLNITKAFNFNGGLTVSLINGFTPSAGNGFDLFDFSSSSGIFSQTNLPALGTSLYWNTTALYTSGEIFSDSATRSPARIISPAHDSILSSANVTFTWDAGRGVALKALWVGSSPFSYNLYAGIEYGSSRTVTLPTDGRTTYVTLLSFINGAWQWNSYNYTAYTSPIAEMVSPTPGSTLTGDRVNFEWSNAPGATYYALWVGTTANSYNLYAAGLTSQSQTVKVPTNGSTIYVTLWTYVNGAWRSRAYTYTAYTAAGTEKAAVLSPTGGSTLDGDRVNFQWNSGVGAIYVALWVGTSAGSYNLYAGVETSLSRVVKVPTNGSTIYVRLFSFISGAWQWNDYTYTACNKVGTEKAAMQSPAPGSTLTGAVTRFSWSSGIGVSYTAFWVGTTQGGYDLYAGVEYGLSRILTLPTNGQTIYVTLWSYVNGAWQSNAYTYTASGP